MRSASWLAVRCGRGFRAQPMGPGKRRRAGPIRSGAGPSFDDAISRFADTYARQVRRDYDALVAAGRSGRVTAMDA